MVNALLSETTRDLFVLIGFVLAVIQTILAIKAIRKHAASGSKSNKSLSSPIIILICASWTMIHGLILGLGFFYFGSLANKEYPGGLYALLLSWLLAYFDFLIIWLVKRLLKHYQYLFDEVLLMTVFFIVVWGLMGNFFDMVWHLISGGSFPMTGTHLLNSTAGIIFTSVSVIAGAVLGALCGYHAASKQNRKRSA